MPSCEGPPSSEMFFKTVSRCAANERTPIEQVVYCDSLTCGIFALFDPKHSFLYVELFSFMLNAVLAAPSRVVNWDRIDGSLLGASSMRDPSGGYREVVRRARLLLRRAATAAELRAAQAVLFVNDYGLSLQQTANMMGCSVPTVGRLRRWVKTTAPDEPPLRAHWGGRRRQNLSLAEERRFLNGIKNQARDGKGIEVKSIWQAYQALLGRSVPDSTIYRLLHRHGWHNAGRGAYQGKITPVQRRPRARRPVPP